MTEFEMVGWHHQLDGLESEQASRVDKGQGSLACCSPWGCQESDDILILINIHFHLSLYALEKEMATHSSFLACKIPWTEEPGILQSMGSQRVGQD